MNLRGCCLSVNALCCFSHNSSSHVLKLTWCCIMLPTYSLRLFPQQQFLCFYFLPLLLPTACICTFTIHNFAKCICCSVSFVCMLLKCHYYWGEHAGNFIKYERKYANGKKIFWCVFKCFWMQFWKHTNYMGVCHDTVYCFLCLLHQETTHASFLFTSVGLTTNM